MRRTIAALIVLGLAVSGYLLERRFALMGGAAGRGVCSTALGLDCDAALTGPTSTFAGLPLAGWGVVYFGTLAAVLLVGGVLGAATSAIAARAALAASLVGAAVAAALLARMSFGGAPFCPLCALVHVVAFALVPLLARAGGRPVRALPGEIRAAFAAVARASGDDDPSTRVALGGLLSVVLAAMVIVQSVFTLELRHTPPTPDPRTSVGAYAIGPRFEIPWDDRDVRFGPEGAELRMVVFGDFECPGCRQFARRLAKMIDSSRGRISAVFKHFPVDASCNRGIAETKHPRACAAARTAEAARLQGKFREFHDALFAAEGALSDEAIEAAARSAGLDAERLRADVSSDAARRKIADDVELGIRLRVDETPTVFLNGRRVPDLGPAGLELILTSQAYDKPVPLPGAPASAPSVERGSDGR
jgi:protein-disulfide isomerase/uncharacterized membrane protein